MQPAERVFLTSFACLWQESAVLEGKVRQPAGSGMSREDGRPPPQGATKDMRLRDKQEKFEKLDRQAEIVGDRICLFFIVTRSPSSIGTLSRVALVLERLLFPRKESRSTDESDLTDGQRRKSARSWGNVTKNNTLYLALF